MPSVLTDPQVTSGEDLRPVHGSPQSGHGGEDEVSLLPVRLPGHKRRQVSTPRTHAHTHKNADTHRNWMNSLNTLIHSCCRRFCGSESCKAREWRREEESTIVIINKANKTATSYMSLIGWPCKPRRRMGKIDGKDRQSARKHAQSISLASGRSLWDFENITLK